MRRATILIAILAGPLLAGCAAPEESGDFTAPRDGDAEGPYDTVGADEPAPDAENQTTPRGSAG